MQLRERGSKGREWEEGKAGLRWKARVACGWMVSLGKFAARSPTLCLLAGDKYHMELRGSPLECALPRAHRNVSLQIENVHSCYLGYPLTLFLHFYLSISISLSECQKLVAILSSLCVLVITINFSYTVAKILFFLNFYIYLNISLISDFHCLVLEHSLLKTY